MKIERIPLERLGLQGASALRAGAIGLLKSGGEWTAVSLPLAVHHTPFYIALASITIVGVNSAPRAGGFGVPRLSYAGNETVFGACGWSGRTTGWEVHLSNAPLRPHLSFCWNLSLYSGSFADVC